MSRRVLTKAGWVDGKAAPQQLNHTMRKLPGELIANDIDDPDKVHEYDAPHVVSTTIKDFGKSLEPPREEKPDNPQKLAKKLHAPGPGERGPCTQWYVDVARMRVMHSLVSRAVDDYAAGLDPDLGVHYLWFETNNVNAYELRKGNPPSNKERPKHLKNIDLVVDIFNPPRSITKLLKERGISFDAGEIFKQATQPHDDEQLVTLQ